LHTLQKNIIVNNIEKRVEELKFRVESVSFQEDNHAIELIDLLKTVLNELDDLIEFNCGVVYIFDPGHNMLKLSASKRLPSKTKEIITTFANGFHFHVFEHKKPLIINDLSKSSYKNYPAASILYVPILLSDSCLGVIGLESEKLNNFTDRHKSIVSSFAELTIPLLKESNLINKIEFQQLEVAVMQSINQLIASRFELEQFFLKVFEQTNRIIDMSTFRIGIFKIDEMAIEYLFYMQDGMKVEKEKELLPESILNTLINDRQFILFNCGEEERDQTYKLDSVVSDQVKCQSFLAVPMIVDDRVMGMIAVQSRPGKMYHQHHAGMLQQIAHLMAIIVDHHYLATSLRSQQSYYEHIFDKFDEGVAVIDSGLNVQFLNKWMRVRYGKNAIGKFCDEVFADWFVRCSEYLQKKPGRSNHILKTKGVDNEPYLLTIDHSPGTANILIFLKTKRSAEEHLDDVANKKRLEAVLDTVRAIAHHLSQPLTGIIGYISLLLDDLHEGENLYNEIKEIEQQVNRVDVLIKKIQDITHFRNKEFPDDQEFMNFDKSFYKNEQKY